MYQRILDYQEIHLLLNGYSWVIIYLVFPIVLVDEVITWKIFLKEGSPIDPSYPTGYSVSSNDKLIPANTLGDTIYFKGLGHDKISYYIFLSLLSFSAK